jgi:hypothetical protein
MALSQHFVVPPEYDNQFTYPAELTLEDKVIDAFIYRIDSNKKGFFKNKHNVLLIFIDNSLNRTDLERNTKIGLLTRLMRGLRDKRLNPLSYFPRNITLFNRCTTVLYEAYNSQIINANEYANFLTSALVHCLSDVNNKHELILDLIMQLKKINHYSPLDFIISSFTADITTIFFNILIKAFNEKKLAREEFYEILTIENSYGLTPLHVAIKNNANALNPYLSAMEKVFSPVQKMNFNMPTQKDSYLEWIVFRGNINILQKYVSHLRKTDDDFAFYILTAQFETLRKIEPYEYASSHPIMKFLRLLQGGSAQDPAKVLDMLKAPLQISPYSHLFRWSVITGHSYYPKPDEIQPDYIMSRQEEEKITAYNIKLEEEESKHSMSFIL